jgi:uncharacterized Rmd1/YagE family protein
LEIPVSRVPVSQTAEFEARALLVGERIDLRGFELPDRLAVDPLSLRVGGGIAVVFRYGAVVFFDVPPQAAEAFLDRLSERVSQPLAERETETLNVSIDPEAREAMQDSTVCLRDRSIERFQLVADVLSKSVVLALYESRVAESFQRVEPVAVDLERKGVDGQRVAELLRHIGGALLSELRIVGRVEVADKPELTWDRPELERLYVRLADEFEIRERYRVLERKLDLISRTAHTVLELLQHRHTLRVEWYIVILIVLEILLTLYQLFFPGA